MTWRSESGRDSPRMDHPNRNLREIRLKQTKMLVSGFIKGEGWWCWTPLLSWHQNHFKSWSSFVKKSQSKKNPRQTILDDLSSHPQRQAPDFGIHQTCASSKPVARGGESVTIWGPVVWDCWDFLMKGMVRDCYERGNPLKTSQIYLISSYWHHIIYAQKKTKKKTSMVS